jgi:cellulose synthase (UDP-forming)
MKYLVHSIDAVIEKYGVFLFLLMLACLVYMSGLRVDFNTQAYISVFFVIALLLIQPLKSQGFWRVLFIVLSSFIVLRYIFWRVSYTLVYEDIISYIGAIALFLAELYGALMFFFSVFVNVRPLQRTPILLPDDESNWPSVDVLIPTYNEPFELVKITLAAASNIDYPLKKLNIYLLDDGGTAVRLNSSNQNIREDAMVRSKQLKAFCRELNITYLTRHDNENAKAGNMNQALKHINGDLLLVLDSDHAPSVDILQKTVGSFVNDKKVFLVQTPHFFINPDPFEKNLSLYHLMPAESDMFYKAIQTGLDFWDSSFFCGSAAVLRRSAIDELGGFSGLTITEDSETAIKLHSRGWKSHYLMYPLISGLQPESFDSFMVQRMRWAQGMVQNFIFNNPLALKNLKIGQRICYLSNMMFWFFPFARLVFLLSPGLYLFFGLKIYHANTLEFFSYTVPFLAVLVLSNHYMFSKVRWIFVSEIYETMQSLFSIRAVLAVLLNPHAPKFSVTPKMERLDQDFISPLSKPFYWTISYTLFAAIFGIWRYSLFPDERSLIAITLFWAFFNLLLLLAALGALYEHRQRRVNPRIPVSIEANWLQQSKGFLEEKRTPLIIKDLSMGGGHLMSKMELTYDHDTELTFIEVQNGPPKKPDSFRVSITNKFSRDGYYFYGVKFHTENLDDYLDLVRFIHGDSSRWINIYDATGKDPGLIKSVIFMIRIGVYHGISHIYVALKSYFQKIINVYV